MALNFPLLLALTPPDAHMALLMMCCDPDLAPSVSIVVPATGGLTTARESQLIGGSDKLPPPPMMREEEISQIARCANRHLRDRVAAGVNSANRLMLIGVIGARKLSNYLRVEQVVDCWWLMKFRMRPTRELISVESNYNMHSNKSRNNLVKR